MTEKKIIVTATVKSEVARSFSFVYDGDTSSRCAMKNAAWDAFNNEHYLREPEISSDETVGMLLSGTELGDPNDCREKPKQRTKKQLWRRVTRLAGEVIMRNDPALCTYGPSMNVLSGASAVRELIRVVHEFEVQGLATTRKKLLSRLEAALKEWEAAQ